MPTTPSAPASSFRLAIDDHAISVERLDGDPARLRLSNGDTTCDVALQLVGALLLGLERCTTRAERLLAKNQRRGLPARTGAPWSDDELTRLQDLFGADHPMDHIAAQLERTPGAIRARLVLLGLLDDPHPRPVRRNGGPGTPAPPPPPPARAPQG